jgi:2-polyprenyl-3-methyl-5-hydroxy-6-metoxy-1,4-benzoquinol methylase
MISYEEHKKHISALPSYFDETLHRRFRAVVKQIAPGERVLDVACGSGTLMAALSTKGCRVSGVDLSPAAVSLVRNKGLEAVVGDVDAFEQDDQMRALLVAEYDAVIFSKCLEYLKNKNRLLPLLKTRKIFIIQRNARYWKFLLRRMFGSERDSSFEVLPYVTSDGTVVDGSCADGLSRWIGSYGFTSRVILGNMFRSRDLVLMCQSLTGRTISAVEIAVPAPETVAVSDQVRT